VLPGLAVVEAAGVALPCAVGELPAFEPVSVVGVLLLELLPQAATSRPPAAMQTAKTMGRKALISAA
jgi:hypothetical protein